MREARGMAAAVARQYKPYTCPFERATIRATFYLARKRDDDGLIAWLKPFRDGLADAGIVRNDSAFTMLPIEQITGKTMNKRVILIISSV